MASIPVIDIKFEWKEVPTSCDPCTGCEEIIYGKQYQLFVLGTPTDKKLCQSCYSVINEQD